MRADEDNFYLTNDLSVGLDGERFFERKWDEEVERNLI